MKMKVQVRSLILLAVAALLVRSQDQTGTRYEDIISVALPQLLPGEEQAFRPILNQLQVETLNTEDVDQSEVSVRLTFPMQETFCSKSQGQPGKPCPLKKNGKLMMCSMMVRHPILEASNNLNTDLSKTNCEYMEAEDAMQKIRTRRSQARKCSRGNGGKIGSIRCRGGGTRLGGGSLIGRPEGGSPPGGGSFTAGFIRDQRDGNRFA